MISMKTRFASVGAVAVAALLYGTPASAQSTRTWVSGVGDDFNPCNRTAPCATFAMAASKTTAGGEINCLDPGGFGAVTITKSLTISCPYTEAGIFATGNGILVNAASTDTVYLRGLDILGGSASGDGVRIVAAAAVHIEDSVIRRFNGVNSFGVSVAVTSPIKLYISNSTIAENGNGATGGGIDINPAVGGSVKAVMNNVRVRDNTQHGVRVNSANGVVTLVMTNMDTSGNAFGVWLQSGQAINAFLIDSVVVDNSIYGIVGNGAAVTMRTGNTTITGNAQGVTVIGGAQLLTYGNNRSIRNPTWGPANDGSFIGGAQPTQ
ncbi:MAG TPA: hypothetical protein VF605_12275 [Allosphingosinicella sp.]|jgi:hypothetical protein